MDASTRCRSLITIGSYNREHTLRVTSLLPFQGLSESRHRIAVPFSIGSQVRGTPCRAFSKDTKVCCGPYRPHTREGLYAYPDLGSCAVPASTMTRSGMSCSIPRSLWKFSRPPRKPLTGGRSFAAIGPGCRRSPTLCWWRRTVPAWTTTIGRRMARGPYARWKASRSSCTCPASATRPHWLRCTSASCLPPARSSYPEGGRRSVPETVYLDLETTGLSPPDDEILEIAVVDNAGAVLLHSLVRPAHTTAWPDAEAIHGLTPADVQDAPALEALRPQIVRAVREKTVVTYNAAFDQAFLPAELAAAAELLGCMVAFAEHYGEWSDWHGGFRWQTLGVATEYVRHRWETPSHRAVADALACRAVWRSLTEPEEQARVEAIKTDEQASWEA